MGNIGCCGDAKAARYLDLRRWRTAVCGMITRHVPGPRRVPSCFRYKARVRSRPVDIPSSLSFCRMCCAMYLGSSGNCLYRVGETHEYAREYLFSMSRRSCCTNSWDVGGLAAGPKRSSAKSLRHGMRAKSLHCRGPDTELCVNAV